MPASTTAPSPASSRRRLLWAFLPLIGLVAAGLLANVGAGARNANAASSSVIVTASVSSVATLAPAVSCSGGLNITVAMNNISSATCPVTFGASNNAALPMTVTDSDAAPFLSGTNFANAGATCTALAVDSVGYKVDSTGLTATSNHPCPTSAGATNLNYRAIPAAATTVCTTNALGNQVCPIAVGVFETGGNAPAGNYTGTLNLAA